MAEIGQMAKMPVVDQPERERIRRALKRYKKQHDRIGDPELQQRMMYVLKCDRSLVPLSTLQRFLKETGRTDDMMVRRYRKFLESVAPPPAGDELGAALVNFLPVRPEREDWFQTFAGTYRTHIRPYESEPHDNILSSAGQVFAVIGQVTAPHAAQPRAFNIPWSVLRLEQGENEGFFRATEAVFDRELQESDQQAPAGKFWLGNTGIFVPFSSNEYLTMVRSFLDTRLYFLRKVTDSPLMLRGMAFRSQGIFDIPSVFPVTSWQPAFEIQITRA